MITDRAIRRARWEGCDPDQINAVVDHVTGRNWIRCHQVTTGDNGTVTLVAEVHAVDRWRINQRLRLITGILRRSGGGILVSVERLAPHTNRAAAAIARAAARRQNGK